LAPILAYVVHYFGWRWGMVFAGGAFLTLGIPLAAVVRRSPEDMGLVPDGAASALRTPDKPDQPSGASEPPPEADIGIWEALRGAPFWLLVVSTLIRVAGLSTVIANFVQILVWKGVDKLAASWFLGVFAALSLPTHLIVGWLADRMNKAKVMAVCMLVSAGGLLVLTYAQSTLLIWLFLPLFSLVEAVFPVTWAMVGELYGRRHFAKVRGNMGFFYQWGGMIGPAAAGAIFDATQSYKSALLGMAALYVVAALLYLVLGRTRLARMRAAASRTP
jgi:sugar phosphate permease